MTRRITYANQLAISLFALQDQKEAMIEQAQLALAILGSSTEIDGFECTASISPDLNVHVGSGTLFSYQNVDATPYGTPPSQIQADTTNQILKLAYKLGSTTFGFVPPSTVGFSRNDLIQISFIEQDNTPTSIPFYAGVGLPPVFQTVNVLRSDIAVIAVKTGIAAATGTQVTPAPDPGNTGMWVITTVHGQTSITSGDIARYPSAPFILEKLKDKISGSSADSKYVSKPQLQYSVPIYAQDTGTVNHIVADFTPEITNYAEGFHVFCKILNTNTGALDADFGGGVIDAVDISGQPLIAGDVVAGMIAEFFSDGTSVQLLNRATGLNASIVGSTYMNTGQTITTITKLNFDTVEFDTNSLWDPINLRWNIVTDGYYRFNFNCAVTNTTSSLPSAILYKNGSFYKILSQIPGGSGSVVLSGLQIIECNGGDYIEAYGVPNGGSPIYGGVAGGLTAMENSSFQLEFIGSL